MAEKRDSIEKTTAAAKECLKHFYPDSKIEFEFSNYTGTYGSQWLVIQCKNDPDKSDTFTYLGPFLRELYPNWAKNHEIFFPLDFFINLRESLQSDRNTRENTELGRFANAVEDYASIYKMIHEKFPDVNIGFKIGFDNNGRTNEIIIFESLNKNDIAKIKKDFPIDPKTENTGLHERVIAYEISTLKESFGAKPPSAPEAPMPPLQFDKGDKKDKGDRGDSKNIQDQPKPTSSSTNNPPSSPAV